MGIMDIILNLQRYSTEVLAYKLDAEFAAAVDAAANLLEAQGERIADLETELQAERHRHDRLQDFEVAEAQQFADAKETIAMLRKKWQAAASIICAHCTECECETHDSLMVMQKKCGNLVGFPDCDMFTSRNAVELLQMKEANRWIPVTEKMPDNFVSVLGFMTDAGPFPAVRECYSVGDGFFFPALEESHPVSHWKPLPVSLEVTDDA